MGDKPEKIYRYRNLKVVVCFGVWITQGRASIEAYSFIRHVLTKCENNPKILVDDGPWYKPALKRLGVDWGHVTFGLRNPIEQWFGILKHRINLFYNRWLHNASVESAQAWINAFVSMSLEICPKINLSECQNGKIKF